MRSYLNMIRAAALDAIRRPALAAAFLGGNLALLLLFYMWLSLPERTVGDLALSTVFALAIVFAVLWLWAASLLFQESASFQQPFRLALRRLPKFLPWAVALVAAAVLILRWEPKRFSFLPWLLCAALLLALVPPASQGVAAAGRVLRNPRYWVAALAAVLVGGCVPALLVSWVPEMSSIAGQTVSLVVRFGLAAILIAAAWLTLVAVVGHLGREAAS